MLIADDDDELRKWLWLTLRPLAAEIIEARDGTELLALLAGAGNIDLVVTDIRLPRKSGLEAALEARLARCAAPFIFITAYGSEETKSAVRSLGRAALLSKPFDCDDLFKQIGRLLGDPSYAAIEPR